VTRLAANLTMLFSELPFSERFAAAQLAGFDACECLFPYELEPDAFAGCISAAKLKLALFNAPPGNWDAGDRGLAAIPERRTEFRSSLATVVDYVDAARPFGVHVMAGLADPRDRAAHTTFLGNLEAALSALEPFGIQILIEPLNARDVPGYFLSSFDLAASIVREVGHPRLRLQFDVYHRQVMRGDVIRGLEDCAPLIGHVQIAGCPDRHEPDTGELDYRAVFRALDAIGYDGFVGCEYRPRSTTLEGLAWRQRLLAP